MKRFLVPLAVFCFFISNFLQAADIAKLAATPKIVIKSESTFAPSVPCGWPYSPHSALNTTTGYSLVVYDVADNCHDYYWASGRILNPTGRSTNKKLKSIPNTTFGVGVAYNPFTQEFLVVYGRDSILGLRTDSNGKAIGKEFVIIQSTPALLNGGPHLIFNQHTSNYILVWDRTDGTAAALLDQSGKLSSSIVTIKKNPGSSGYYDDSPGRVLDVALLPSGKKLLILLRQRFSFTQGDYWLASVDSQLRNVKSGNVHKLNDDPVNHFFNPADDGFRSRWGGALAVLPDGSAAAFYADNTQLKQRKINLKGKLSGPASPAFSAPLDQVDLVDPTVSYSSSPKGSVGLLIASQEGTDNPDIVFAQTLDSQGRPAGDPVKLYETPAGHDQIITQWGALVTSLPSNASDNLFHFAFFAVPIHFKNHGTGKMIKMNLDVQP